MLFYIRRRRDVFCSALKVKTYSTHRSWRTAGFRKPQHTSRTPFSMHLCLLCSPTKTAGRAV
jgi:hypothetical protein